MPRHYNSCNRQVSHSLAQVVKAPWSGSDIGPWTNTTPLISKAGYGPVYCVALDYRVP